MLINQFIAPSTAVNDIETPENPPFPPISTAIQSEALTGVRRQPMALLQPRSIKSSVFGRI